MYQMIVNQETELIEEIPSQGNTDLIETNEDSKDIDKDFHLKKTKKTCLRKKIESENHDLEEANLELNNTTASFKSPEDSQKAFQSPDKDPNAELLLMESEIKVSRKLLCF